MKLKEKAVLRYLEITGNLGEIGLDLLFTEGSRGIEKIRNLNYQGNKKKNALDFYFKKEDLNVKKPVLFYIHGGGFVSGYKGPRRFYCYKWVEKGFFAVNINYYYGHMHPFPEYLHQIFKAIEFVLENKEKYNLDTENIIIAGESVGAYLASLICGIVNNKRLYEKFGINFKFKDEFAVRGNILISGFFDLNNLLKLNFPNMKWFLMALTALGADEVEEYLKSQEAGDISPINYIDGNYPPTAVILSAKDNLAPSSIALCDKLENNGVPFMKYTCTGLSGVHAGGICPKTKSGAKSIKLTQDFISSILSI